MKKNTGGFQNPKKLLDSFWSFFSDKSHGKVEEGFKFCKRHMCEAIPLLSINWVFWPTPTPLWINRSSRHPEKYHIKKNPISQLFRFGRCKRPVSSKLCGRGRLPLLVSLGGKTGWLPWYVARRCHVLSQFSLTSIHAPVTLWRPSMRRATLRSFFQPHFALFKVAGNDAFGMMRFLKSCTWHELCYVFCLGIMLIDQENPAECRS